MGKVRALTLTAALVFSGSAVAQEPSRVLTWQDCVSLASTKNPELLGARRSVAADRARYLGSYNGFLPGLSLTSRYSDSRDASGSSRWSADGTASIDLFNLNNFASVRSASASLSSAEAALRLRSADLRRSLRRAFAALLYSQEQVAVSERILAIRTQNSDLVSLKYESGRESKGNMLRARAELAEARAASAQSLRSLRVARRELGRQLGLDSFEVLIATGTLDAGPLPPAADPAAIAARHPSVLSREAARRSANAALLSARSEFAPNVRASYSRGRVGPSYFPGRDPGWSASGVLSLPLFGSGLTAAYFDASAAKRELERSEQDLRAARNLVASELELSWADLAFAVDQLDVRRSFLEAARQRNSEASVRYSSGLMSFENWELIVADLVNSERGWVSARRDAVLAEADWNRALGLTLEDR